MNIFESTMRACMKGKLLSEDSRGPEDEEYDTNDNWYAVQISRITNSPDSSYTGGFDKDAKKLLKDAQADSLVQNLSIEAFGYDDITFVFQAEDPKTARKFAKRIAAFAEEPSQEEIDEYDSDAVALLFGPGTEQEIIEEPTSFDLEEFH